MEKKRTIHNNKGFSLVEMLIVVALLSILISIAIMSYSTVTNAQLSEAARTYEAAINTAIAQSMAKGSEAGKLTIGMENGELYYMIGDTATAPKEEICDARFTPRYIMGSTGGYTPGTGAPLGIPFADGCEYTIYFNSNGTVDTVNSTSGGISRLTFSFNNRVIEVFLYLETGKHDVIMHYM
ncbi:MAG: prepilin-type N-terminal cleavage/methylation domain-containing protein [Lachnospiraceae bacterium]|nr:prepilin-type N-terminal cleavage/methylation domain-containing protein [Lachnospiraceae bacterium]